MRRAPIPPHDGTRVVDTPGFTLGRGRFARIGAVESVASTEEIRAAPGAIDRGDASAEERRRAIIRRFSTAQRRGGSMHEVDAIQADDELSRLLDRVEAGEEVVITRHGKPVAHLVRPRASRDDGQAQGAAAAIRAMSRGVTLGGLSLGSLVAEGRR